MLADGIPNNGKATVIFPAQTKGWKGGNLFVEGLFKIEVLNHIAYAVSSDTPGTLDMHSPDITFKNLPEPTITVKKGQVPKAPTVTAVANYCHNKVAQVTFTEEDHTTYLLRKWVATDNCKNTATAQQFIYYEKEAPINSLHFVGDLPKDMHVQCKGEIPEKATVKAEGADNIRIDYEEEMTEGDKKAYKLTRSWIAYADNALPIRHTQQILLRDTKRPELSAYPKSMIVKSEDEVPFKENLTATDNCDGLLRVDSSESSKYENGKKKEVTYVWFVEDNAHNENRYVQVITINPAITTPTVVTPTVSSPTVSTPTVSTPTVSTPTVSTPTVSTPTVSSPTVTTPTVSSPTVSTPTVTTPTEISPEVSEVIIYNGVSTHNSHNYFKVENTDENRPIYVIIFDEMGLKVYENADYGKPEVFRGYANVKNVIGKKALAGTYFYILRYYKNNTLEEKKGFLYIR